MLAREGGGSSRLIDGSRLLCDKGNDENSGRGTAADLGRCAWQGEAAAGPAGNTAGGLGRHVRELRVAEGDVPMGVAHGPGSRARLGMCVQRHSGGDTWRRSGARDAVTRAMSRVPA
jgi:hypothetical protein